MEAKKKIGETLRAQREHKNISYFKIQKETWIINPQVKNMENATSNYTIDNLLKLCDVLGLEIKLKEKPLNN